MANSNQVIKPKINLLNNKFRITFVSFLAYFAMSGMLAPIGIISGPMSETFNLPITEITAGFSWLTFGILAGAISALFVFNWVQLKKVMVILYCAISASLIALFFQEQIALIWPILGLVGLCAGTGLAGAAFIISRTYDDNQRASMLVITDGWFSLAGIVCSWIAIYLVSRNFHWSGSYQFVALVALIMLLLLFFSQLPNSKNEPGDSVNTETWSLKVWLCIFALFLFTLGQNSILWWLPTYAEQYLNAPRDQAGSLVGQFWSGMFAAQLFVAWWVLKIGVQRLVIIAGITTATGSIFMWVYPEIDGLVILALLWGFANLGLLKLVLSLATQMLKLPSARLISGLLLSASLGTAVSPWLTSQIVEASNTRFIIQFGTLCYIVLFCLVFWATRLHQADLITNEAMTRSS
jgi:TsgA-like MFS transporter